MGCGAASAGAGLERRLCWRRGGQTPSPPPTLSHQGDEKCYFVGKVAAQPGMSAVGAAYAQAPLIIGHARAFLPGVFTASAEALEMLVAPGDSEMGACGWVGGGGTTIKRVRSLPPAAASVVPLVPDTVGSEHRGHRGHRPTSTHAHSSPPAVAQHHIGLEPVLGAVGLAAEGVDWWEGAEPSARPRSASDVVSF